MVLCRVREDPGENGARLALAHMSWSVPGKVLRLVNGLDPALGCGDALRWPGSPRWSALRPGR